MPKIQWMSSSRRKKSVSSIKDKACCTHKRFGTKSFVAFLLSVFLHFGCASLQVAHVFVCRVVPFFMILLAQCETHLLCVLFRQFYYLFMIWRFMSGHKKRLCVYICLRGFGHRYKKMFLDIFIMKIMVILEKQTVRRAS